jgi:hypothetical protein
MDGFQVRPMHETAEQPLLTTTFIELHIQFKNFKRKPAREVQVQAD